MIDRQTIHKLLWASTSVALCAVVTGCGQDSPVAQVKGKVLYKDGSVPKGAIRVVRFEPAVDSTSVVRKAASSDIDAADGSFELFTRKPGDGVYRGKYKVTFTVLPDPRSQESLILDKYTISATTPYEVSVDRDVDDLAFEIEPYQ
jgi:hypothetical protein